MSQKICDRLANTIFSVSGEPRSSSEEQRPENVNVEDETVVDEEQGNGAP